MKRSSLVMTLFFALSFANIFLFVIFQVFVSKRFILADENELRTLLAQEGPSQSTLVDAAGSMHDFQQHVVRTVANTQDSIVNIVATKNLQFFLQDPNSFWGEGRVAQRRTEIGGGSGIIVRKDGLVMTNKHVVSDLDADYSVVLNDGEVYTVSTIWRDPVIDVAVLKLEISEGQQDQFQPATFIDFDTPVEIGQFVLAIGNALTEYQNSVTFGILSAKNRSLGLQQSSDSLYIGLYQTDTPINPGNSGGPLLDIYGNVLGINTAVSTQGDGIGFSLPVTQQFVDSTLDVIDEYNQIVRPFMGVAYSDLGRRNIEELELNVDAGTYIEGVLDGSAAAEAGIEEGDIILAIDGRKILPDLPFMYHVDQYRPEDTISLSVLRDGKKINLSVVLGKR